MCFGDIGGLKKPPDRSKWKLFPQGINPKISPPLSGERATKRVSKRGRAMEENSERDRELFRECSLSLSLVKSFAWWWGVGGVLARAPLLCVQALQEQRTDIRPKNTHTRPQQLSGNHESITLFLQPSPTLALLRAVGSVFRKVHARVCVFSYLLFLHHQPCDLQPLEPFKRNLPSQHLPENLDTGDASGPAAAQITLDNPISTKTLRCFIGNP